MNFLTNNGTYMFLVECMQRDWFWIGALISLCIINVILYLAVFTEALKQWRRLKQRKDAPIASGFLTLAGVFAFCAMSGYLTDVISLFMPHYRIKVILLIPLVIFTAYFVFYLKNSDLIGRMFAMEQEQQDNEGSPSENQNV